MTDRCEPPEALRNITAQHFLVMGGSPGFLVWKWTGHSWVDSCGIGVTVDEATRNDLSYCGRVPSPEIISDLVTALDRIAHMHRAEALIAIAALHKYDPSRRVLNNSSLPVIDTTIKPPAAYYPERQG